ncbi:helix-turn-helix domain-containing protein [Actinoplanes sp. NPDC051859]|uniref:helix-turn-helix domain-containing protein n=1 Tax=Actinoplanes sp. NPDC051859 TaxID=3363909 RepID=UPI0037BDD0D7
MAHPAPDGEGTGDHIARLRKAAGLTQSQLAQRANVSKSLLSKVEIGDKPASHALVAAVAHALRVPIERVHGQPYNEGPAQASIDELRAVIRAYDLPPDDDIAVRPLSELRAAVHDIGELRRAGRYARLGERLPTVIAAVSAAAHAAGTDNRRTAFSLLVSAYYAAHGLAYRLGHADLSESIEHKLGWAAEQTGDPLAVALARWTRVNSFQAAGDYDHGLSLLDRARADLTTGNVTAGPAATVLLGSMHLRAVTLASRRGDHDAVRDHLDQAYQLADELGSSDQIYYHLTFGPENTRIHDTAAHIELGRPEQAIRLADSWTPSADMPPTRAGHHYIDLARAHLMTGDRAATLHDLQRAREIAAEQTRYHPMVRETARVLISMHHRSNRDLTQFAAWLGLP